MIPLRDVSEQKQVRKKAVPSQLGFIMRCLKSWQETGGQFRERETEELSPWDHTALPSSVSPSPISVWPHKTCSLSFPWHRALYVCPNSDPSFLSLLWLVLLSTVSLSLSIDPAARPSLSSKGRTWRRDDVSVKEIVSQEFPVSDRVNWRLWGSFNWLPHNRIYSSHGLTVTVWPEKYTKAVTFLGVATFFGTLLWSLRRLPVYPCKENWIQRWRRGINPSIIPMKVAWWRIKVDLLVKSTLYWFRITVYFLYQRLVIHPCCTNNQSQSKGSWSNFTLCRYCW